jgi:hypothetical protein
MPVLLSQETLERVPVGLSLCEHLGLGVHEGIDLRTPLGAAQLMLPVNRLCLLVERAEFPGQRRMVIGEGAELLHSLCTRRICQCV